LVGAQGPGNDDQTVEETVSDREPSRTQRCSRLHVLSKRQCCVLLRFCLAPFIE
jgi:hypothetical protein